MIDLQKELKGNYEIIPSTDGSLCLRVKPQDTWVYFHGHFPAMPILPAVGVADISRYFIENLLLKKKMSLKKIGFFKIKTPIQPGQILVLEIRQEENLRFQVSWKNETENSSSAELVIELI